jgi:hypothetical protein
MEHRAGAFKAARSQPGIAVQKWLCRKFRHLAVFAEKTGCLPHKHTFFSPNN